jgi:hypothetical protein
LPLDTYAISLDGAFEMGYAICFAVMQAEGGKRYVLVPLRSPASLARSYRFPARILVGGPFPKNIAISSKVGGGEPGEETIQAMKYNCQILNPEWTGGDVPPGNVPFWFLQGETVSAYDVGWHHPNRPPVPDGTNLTERTLAIGTVVYLDQYLHVPASGGGADGVIYFIEKFPRFKVECG